MLSGLSIIFNKVTTCPCCKSSKTI